MKKQLLFTFFLLLVLLKINAQEVFTLKGIVFVNGKTERLNNAQIANQTKNTQTQTDDFGTFSIQVSINDILVISKANFQEITKVIIKKQNIILYLKPAQVLEEVIIKAKTQKAEQNEILEGYKSKGVYNNGKTPFLMYIFNPLTALQNLLGNDAKNARTFSKYISRENSESFVDAKFNATLINSNTNISQANLAEFMYLHRPTYQNAKYWNDYDAINYIKLQYIKYLSNKGKLP